MRSIRLRKILACIVISCVAFGAVGCADKNTDPENNSNIVSENLDNQQSNDNQEEDIVDNQESIKTIELLLYSKDVNTDEQVIVGEVEVNEDLSLEEKIEKLSKELSEKVFDNLPIEFVKINDIEGKKIALFNLDELGNNAKDITFDKYEGINWINNYFAGSAGGSVTEYTLITTLLQKNYTGEWIDGIEFTYKNSKIEFDHVPALGEITYR
ncbi:hypothetical protein [uncultured Clostridium sp.]|uniref:hypothetical protein n=1 Tax=uncultured Clostridium sp. TaxID=59620 RepID=UPI0025CDB333|nr:hypothetical protein [uncultured Clostridium sp.]